MHHGTGMRLAKLFPRFTVWSMPFVMLLISGLSIGIAISEFAGKLADAVLVAMAAGTFIYVGATEVIAEEFESPQDKWKKFFALSGKPGEMWLCFVSKIVSYSIEDRILR